MRRIKNRDKLKKRDLIINLLKSESSNAERDYMKHLNNNTNVDNNNNNNTNVDNNNTNVDNNNTNDDDDTYDSKIREKISDIRMILNRLGNILTNKDKKKLKRSFME